MEGCVVKIAKRKYENLIVWGPISLLLILAVTTVFFVVRAKKDTTANTPVHSSSRFNVSQVIDGDTVKVIGSDNIELDVRLAEIDAPEIDQPYGKISKATLEELISGKDVELRDIKKGRYGRSVANIYCGGVWINIELVKSGAAWRYKESSSDDLIMAEAHARKERRGLWGEPEPIAPWEWREQKR